MARVKVKDGPFAGFEGEIVADYGAKLRVALEIFGRRTEIDVGREQTDAPPAPPMELLPFAKVLDEIEAWMRSAAPEVYAAHGVTAEEDLQALAALGPGAQDLVALYRRFGGTTDWQSFVGGLELSPLRSAFSVREMMNGLEADGTFYRWMPNEWWHPGWLPFMDNHSYDMVCVDLVGTMGGEPGQIVWWSKDSESRPIVAPSLHAWLAAFVAGRELGAWEWDPHSGIRVVPGREHEEHLLLARALPGFPKPTAARMRKEVEGVEPPPKPARSVTGCTIVKQFWAPASTSVHALAYAEGLLAVGQYDWGEAPGGLSLVDPGSGALVEVVIGKKEGSVLEATPVRAGLIVRRLRDFANEVVLVRGGELEVLVGGLPTRMEAFVGAAEDLVAVAAERIEIIRLDGGSERWTLDISGIGCVVGLSPDGTVLAVGHREQPLRWYDAKTGKQLGQTEETVYAKQIAFGVDGDVWVAENRESQRWDLATGARRDHAAASNPFVVALHRETKRVAFAGYGGRVRVLDAVTGQLIAEDDTHRSRVYGLAWDPAGGRLWSADGGGQIVERSLAG